MPRRLAPAGVLIVLAGCSGEAPAQPAAHAGAAASAAAPVELTRELRGRLLLRLGPDPSQVDLWEIDGAGDRAQALTTTEQMGPVSSFGAAYGRIVAAVAPTGVDQLVRLSRTGAVGQEYGEGFSPAPGPGGRLAFSRLAGDPDARTSRLYVRSRAGRERAVRGTAGSYAAGWLPRRRLVAAVATDDGRTNTLIVNAGTRRARRVKTDLRAGGILTVSRQGRIAFGYVGRMVIGDRKSRRFRRATPPWAPLAWSRDGRRLLVTDGPRLGLMDPSSLRVSVVGRATEGEIHSAAWLG